MTCTYTNTQNASLDIEKQSVGGTATFDYAVNGSGLAPFTRNTAVANPTTNAPFAFTGFQLGTKDVQETPEPGWTLTNIVCTANGAVITIGTGIGGTFAQGATAGFDPGDTTVRAVIDGRGHPDLHVHEHRERLALDRARRPWAATAPSTSPAPAPASRPPSPSPPRVARAPTRATPSRSARRSSAPRR